MKNEKSLGKVAGKWISSCVDKYYQQTVHFILPTLDERTLMDERWVLVFTLQLSDVGFFSTINKPIKQDNNEGLFEVQQST